jgi:hypothetical protein
VYAQGLYSNLIEIGSMERPAVKTAGFCHSIQKTFGEFINNVDFFCQRLTKYFLGYIILIGYKY